MMAKDCSISNVFLLEALVVLSMLLLLVGILVLEIVHHGHPSATGAAINSAMLRLLLVLTKHSVKIGGRTIVR